ARRPARSPALLGHGSQDRFRQSGDGRSGDHRGAEEPSLSGWRRRRVRRFPLVPGHFDRRGLSTAMSPLLYQTWPQGPFNAAQDSLDPPTADPVRALLLQNCYPVPGPPGSAVVGRPGYQQLGGQLGGAGARRVQGFHQYTKADGTEFTIAFVGGLMYTLNW